MFEVRSSSDTHHTYLAKPCHFRIDAGCASRTFRVRSGFPVVHPAPDCVQTSQAKKKYIRCVLFQHNLRRSNAKVEGKNLRSSSRAFAEVTSAAFFLEENRLKTVRFAATSFAGISSPATNNGNA